MRCCAVLLMANQLVGQVAVSGCCGQSGRWRGGDGGCAPPFGGSLPYLWAAVIVAGLTISLAAMLRGVRAWWGAVNNVVVVVIGKHSLVRLEVQYLDREIYSQILSFRHLGIDPLQMRRVDRSY